MRGRGEARGPAALARARRLRRRGRLDEAAAVLAAVAALGDGEHSPVAAYLLGDVLARQGRRAEAGSAYRDAAHSGHPVAGPDAALPLAQLYEAQFGWGFARESFLAATRSTHPPIAGMASYGYAFSRERQGEVAYAVRDYRRVAAGDDPASAALARDALRRLGGGGPGVPAADSDAYAFRVTMPGVVTALTTGDPALLADPGLVDALLARHRHVHLLGVPYDVRQVGRGYHAEFRRRRPPGREPHDTGPFVTGEVADDVPVGVALFRDDFV